MVLLFILFILLFSFECALKIDPKDLYAWNNKGSVLDDLGKY